MALQKSYQAETGQDYPLAYHKIQQIRIDLFQSRITVILWTYKDDAARTANKQPVSCVEKVCQGEDYNMVFPAGKVDIVGELYEWLKKIDYADALDV